MLLEQIETLRRNLPDEPTPPSKADLEALTEAIQLLNQEKTTVIRYQEALNNKKLYVRLTAELKIYEAIIKELEPKSGIRKSILTHSMAPLQEFFNNRLSQMLPKYRVRLECDDGFSIRLLSEDGELDAIKSASEGELSRIRFVLMYMINALSPYRILMFDKTDALDAGALIDLIQFLKTEEIQQSYDHIFIAVIDYVEVEEFLKNETEFKIIRMSPKKNPALAA